MNPITKWYCGCKTGARTVGCYACIVFVAFVEDNANMSSIP